MADRVSALKGHANARRFGEAGVPGITLSDVPDLMLHQVAVWPDTLSAVGLKTAKTVGAFKAPEPCSSVLGKTGTVLRVEPLKFWILGAQAPDLEPEEGATLDLSHSRTHVRVSGQQAATLLNRHLPLDLRETGFPIGSVASTAFHHVGITLWRSESGYELFLPRGFALSLWEMLLESAEQFGCEVE